MGKRLNIGLLVDDIDAVFTIEACKGAVLGAQAIDANMYIFPGGYLDFENISDEHLKYEYQYNTIFSFANNKKIDILYVMMGMIGGRVPVETRTKFLAQFSDIPVIALYTRMQDYPSVIFNNRIGFQHAIRHLITGHNVSKIGYVSGPKTNVDAIERLETFKQVLTEENIPIHDEWIIYGNFEESTECLIRELVENHPEIDALVFANDRMALGGYRALHKMNISIGTDIRIVSFDNSSFASSLNPPLSTVEANAAELSYQAIVHAEEIIQTGTINCLEIETHFVRRSSCGCMELDSESLAHILNITAETRKEDVNLSLINKYLFGDFVKDSTLQDIENLLAVLIEILFEIAETNNFTDNKKQLEIIFSQIISKPLLQYTTVELLFNFLMYIGRTLLKHFDRVEDKLSFTYLFSNMYRNLAISNCQIVAQQQEGLGIISHLVNDMSARMFLIDSSDAIPYAHALENLDTVGINSAYLYTFQSKYSRARGDDWVVPQRLLFRAHCHNGELFDVPELEQLISTEDIIDNPYMPTDHRVTMVLSPLFSGEDLFGLLMSEVEFNDFRNIATVTFQLSSIMKSLLLLEQQQSMHKALENDLDIARKNNQELNEISKSDELTGLYNRRGFLEYTRNAIYNPHNSNKRALIVYADMDNLKMINDNYGHDEGDFALREIASIFRDAFRSTDIIARMGGDEFTAFALIDVEDYEIIIRRRINQITARHNDSIDKPYSVEMSLGIYEFICTSDTDIYLLLDAADELLYEEKRRKKSKQGSYR